MRIPCGVHLGFMASCSNPASPRVVHSREVHDTSTTATVSDVADLPGESFRADHGGGLLRRTHGYLPAAVRTRDPGTRAPTRRSPCSHRLSDRDVDGAATLERISRRGVPVLSAARSNSASADVAPTIAAMQIQDVVTAARSPWQTRVCRALHRLDPV